MMYSRFSPFQQDMDALREHINQAFEPIVRTVVQEGRNVFSPVPVELIESPTHFRLRASLPGVNPDTIDVHATPNTLIISVESNDTETKNDETVLLKEIFHGKLKRSLEFKDPIQTDGIQADYQLGILTLEIPKLQASAEKKVKVNINTSATSY
jgi:HSP20 family protein